MTWDVIVIGVGGMGSAVAYQLAARGCKVLALEQHNIPHDLGSSHGVNRMIRLAYAEDPRYVPMVRRSYKLWRELGRKVREQLLFITGGVDAGAENSWMVQGSLKSCVEHGLKFELLTSAELHRRFPGFRLPKRMVALYQPQGGFVLSERSIVAHVSLALDLGAEIHAREEVLRWEVRGRKVVVQTNKATYSAARLVITAGAWAGEIIKSLKGVVNAERQVLLWVQPKRPELFRMGAFPVFYMQDGQEKFYGMPPYGIPGFKFGMYNHLRERVNPNSVDRECHPKDEQILRARVRKYFPEANGPTVAMKTCLFENSSDEHFILDHHPEFPQVSIAAGFSGHGFKFCPVVGEIMADLALEGGTRSFDLSLFRMDRFRATPKGDPRTKKKRTDAARYD